MVLHLVDSDSCPHRVSEGVPCGRVLQAEADLPLCRVDVYTLVYVWDVGQSSWRSE